jgi:hypothetical protein
MSRGIVCSVLTIAAVFFGVLALATLIPHSGKTISDLGYYSWCPFAPWSTLTLMMLGSVSWAVRQHIRSLPEERA